MLVICYLNIYLTKEGVMREAGYVFFLSRVSSTIIHLNIYICPFYCEVGWFVGWLCFTSHRRRGH